MTTPSRSFGLPLEFASCLALLAAPGCREYTCVDYGNCPSETVDASAMSTCSGTDCVATSDGTSPATWTEGTNSPTLESVSSVANSSPDSTTRGEGVEATQSTGSPSPASETTVGSEATTSIEEVPSSEEPPGCPNAPGGVCECEYGDTQRCALDGAKGACADGNQTCTADGVFGPCDVVAATNDDCSIKGNDADCDGTPNSGCPCVDGDTQECGPDTDVGACRYGVSTCAGSTYGECIGAVERASRQCDSSQDNDCDGEPDNTLDDTCKCEPGDTQQCNKHPGFDGVGTCRPGNQTCELSEDGTHSDWGSCSGDVAPKASDSCIEGDNSDCVGSANTNCTCIAGRTETCGARYSSMGICASVSLTCQTNGTWPGNASCMAAAAQEICNNNLDENCDGTVNDAASCPCSAVPSPCVHGTCNVGSGSAFTCNCTGTGYEGTLCDKPIALTVDGPVGATSCEVLGVSDSGTVVAADCEIGESMPRAHFWTGNAWVKAVVPAGYPVAYLGVLSADGTKAAGTLRNANGTNYGARWSGLSNAATLLHTPEWKDVSSMSANGNSISALDPGGNVSIWMGGGGNAPTIYIANGGVHAIFSGDGTKVFTPEVGDSEGFRIWTSSTSSTFHSLAADLYPIAASNDGTVMIGDFEFGGPNTIYKYSSSGAVGLNSTADCLPLSLSSDGRYVLGKCAGGLYRWADAAPSTVQSLITSTGSSAAIRTDVEGRMSYNAKYVALPSTGSGFVVAHMPSP